MSQRRKDLLVFGLAGASTFVLLLALEWHWLTIAAWLMGRDQVIFDEQAPWIRGLQTLIGSVPWIACAGLLVFAVVRTRWTRLLAFAGVQVLGWGLVVGGLLFGPVAQDYASREPFDAAVWKSENGEAPRGLRVQMVDDLMHKQTLVGMARQQVDSLLGVPPETGYFRDYEYVYWLGQERGLFSIDSEWLVLKFDHDVVSEARVVTD